ncbi:XtrA/YqaO family protein [Psychrobacillus sp. FSL H8-0484]|uniref:XtrA/YqaO family protein n=1 Tax=Psychrobacillus sp. FSL H8-0484 TaxID=2921390 RepID=UPI0030FB6090
MRMREVEVDPKGDINLNTKEIPNPCIIVISKDKAKMIELPSFAETTIKTHQGKVVRVKWNEGEDF